MLLNSKCLDIIKLVLHNECGARSAVSLLACNVASELKRAE